jgi:hypothetical protein
MKEVTMLKSTQGPGTKNEGLDDKEGAGTRALLGGMNALLAFGACVLAAG